MLVSIITPWKDQAHLIADYEKAVQGAEVITIDNHSSESASSALRAMSDRLGGTVIVNSENRWFAAANNQGLALAKGEIVCFLNSDVAGSAAWLYAVRNMVTDDALFGPSVGSQNIDGLNVPYVEGWCVAATRRTWDTLGGWDEINFPSPYWEDNDLSFRALCRDMSLVRTGWALRHKGNSTSKAVSGWDAQVGHNHAYFSATVCAQRQNGHIDAAGMAQCAIQSPSSVDVTRLIQACFAMGRDALTVSNDTLGVDPAPGIAKVLCVTHRTLSEETRTVVSEGMQIRLDHCGAILAAVYGAF